MEPQSPTAEGNQTTGAVKCWVWFPVPDQELIWSGPKPCSYFCACSPEGSVEQAMTQTWLTCSTVFLAEGRNSGDAAPKFIPAASGSNCLRKTGLRLEVSRAELWGAALACLGTPVLLCFLGRTALGEKQGKGNTCFSSKPNIDISCILKLLFSNHCWRKIFVSLEQNLKLECLWEWWEIVFKEKTLFFWHV